jgi:hypothetical protein
MITIFGLSMMPFYRHQTIKLHWVRGQANFPYLVSSLVKSVLIALSMRGYNLLYHVQVDLGLKTAEQGSDLGSK